MQTNSPPLQHEYTEDRKASLPGVELSIYAAFKGVVRLLCYLRSKSLCWFSIT